MCFASYPPEIPGDFPFQFRVNRLSPAPPVAPPHIRFLYVGLTLCYRLPSSVCCHPDSAESLDLPRNRRPMNFGGTLRVRPTGRTHKKSIRYGVTDARSLRFAINPFEEKQRRPLYSVLTINWGLTFNEPTIGDASKDSRTSPSSFSADALPLILTVIESCAIESGFVSMRPETSVFRHSSSTPSREANSSAPILTQPATDHKRISAGLAPKSDPPKSLGSSAMHEKFLERMKLLVLLFHSALAKSGTKEHPEAVVVFVILNS